LISDGQNYRILSDIIGDEDHLGDMDFKVAGTSTGITAIQMDIKIKGLTSQIMEEALEQARKGRLHILGEMAKTIQTQRDHFKEGVPRIEMIKIPQDKIGALIGPGGKNIKALQEGYQVQIEVDEDGTVRVLGSDPKVLQECVSTVKLQLTGPEIGSDYVGTVVTVKDYGAFVDLAPGVSGLVHVSEFTNDRVADPSEYVREGDQCHVRVVEIDRMGRIKLSAKVVAPLKKRGK
ncbi:MAG: S1 RNA-binding domain-containing protein, partial [Bdellovibrionota bacterium]